jgi:3-deoxy-D-manno-octulosonic-acid transferase
MVFFIKYEFWPNYLNDLREQQIPTYLVSGIFRENQMFFGMAHFIEKH